MCLVHAVNLRKRRGARVHRTSARAQTDNLTGAPAPRRALPAADVGRRRQLRSDHLGAHAPRAVLLHRVDRGDEALGARLHGVTNRLLDRVAAHESGLVGAAEVRAAEQDRPSRSCPEVTVLRTTTCSRGSFSGARAASALEASDVLGRRGARALDRDHEHRTRRRLDQLDVLQADVRPRRRDLARPAPPAAGGASTGTASPRSRDR